MTVREEVELFGGPEHLLGCRHLPAGPATAGVVVCSSAPFAGPVDHGRTARLARRLARAGVAVQRFHHRGVAPSDGDVAGVGFDELVEDARRALDLLRDRTGVDRAAFVGVRIGALVAARLARAHDGAPVALWQPATDPGDVLEQAASVRRRRRTLDAPTSWPAATSGDTAPAGAADLFDSRLATDLLERANVGDLVAELGPGPRPLLVVQTGPGDGLDPHLEQVVARCRARGLAVGTAVHPCDGERDGVPVPVAPTDALVAGTAGWLAGRLGAVPAAEGDR